MDISELSIVLVEPSHAQCRIISRMLEDAGAKDVRWFSGGDEALQAISHLMPDLVISAMYLPDMTGADLVYAIRREPRFEQIMFMLVSSETNDLYLEPIRQAGVISILPKPFDPKDLRRALIATADIIEPHGIEDGAVMEDLRVLLVDDSETSRGMMRRMLVGMGVADIAEAKTGQEAVQLLQDGYFDLVLTDYNMPEMDGCELVKFIRHSPTHSSIPILMVTSESDQSRLAAVHQEGVSAICNKPFNPLTMKDLILKLLAS